MPQNLKSFVTKYYLMKMQHNPNDTNRWDEHVTKPIWEYSPNYTWNYSSCLICKMAHPPNLKVVKTPDDEIIGYICDFCSQKYEILIKRKHPSNK